MITGSKLKCLIVETCPATPHFETSIEISRVLSDQGHDVIYFPLFLYLSHIDFLSKRRIDDVMDPRVWWLNYAKEKLPASVRWLTEVEDIQEVTESISPSVKSSIEQGVYSSLTQRLLLPKNLLELVDYHAWYKVIFDSAVRAYVLSKRATLLSAADTVITFNGRFANSTGVSLAASEYDCKVYFHERGPDIKKYQLWSRKIHDLRSYYHQIIEHCGPSKLDFEKQLIASRWFRKKRHGKTTNWMPFSIASGKKQSKYTKFNVFFSSSMDEYDYIENTFWSVGLGEQIEALRKLIDVHERCEKTLVIRIHPNIRNKHPLEQAFWTSLASEFKNSSCIFFENFDSGCDSYSLLDDAEIVFHAGSTLAIESIYSGKPTYAITQWVGLYDESTLLVSSEQAIRNLILSDTPRISGIEFALRFGYFQETSGVTHEYYTPQGLFEGELTNP